MYCWQKTLFFPFKKLIDWLDASAWWKFSFKRCQDLFPWFHMLPIHFSHREPYSSWGSQSGCRLVKPLHFFWSSLHICSMYVSNLEGKHTYGLEKQRSSNFLAISLGQWWSRERDVVIGARPNPDHGHCSRPKPN